LFRVPYSMNSGSFSSICKTIVKSASLFMPTTVLPSSSILNTILEIFYGDNSTTIGDIGLNVIRILTMPIFARM
jgi:hypothetical protein